VLDRLEIRDASISGVARFLKTTGLLLATDSDSPYHRAPSAGRTARTNIPPVVRFDRLALLVSQTGATRLHEAADQAQHAAVPRLLQLRETDFVVLRMLSQGETRLKIATELDCSERSVYRTQRELQRKLNAPNLLSMLEVASALQLVGPVR